MFLCLKNAFLFEVLMIDVQEKLKKDLKIIPLSNRTGVLGRGRPTTRATYLLTLVGVTKWIGSSWSKEIRFPIHTIHACDTT